MATSLLSCLPSDPLTALDTHQTAIGEAWSLHPERSRGLSEALAAAWWEEVLDRAHRHCLVVEPVELHFADGSHRPGYVLRGVDRRLAAQRRSSGSRGGAGVRAVVAWDSPGLPDLSTSPTPPSVSPSADDDIPF
jgi:hypothetical protein